MPIYEFKCNKCDHVFEELCSWDDIKSLKCEKCKSKRLSHVPSRNITLLGLNSSFEYVAKKNYERATQESAAARKAAGIPEYKNIDDTDNGNKMNFIE